jgi:subtilase family serine protease
VISITFDTTGKSGTRQIQVTVDPDNAIEETDEEDNQVVKPMTVSPPSAVQSQESAVRTQDSGLRTQDSGLNLTVAIEEVTVEPLGESDSLLLVTATVANAGNADAEGVLVQFMDLGPAGLGGLQRLPSLDAAASAATQFSFVLPGPVEINAPRTIEVTVDPYDTIAEVDEADNVTSQDVDVAALRAEPMEVSVMR